jgi:hypothetical protein
VIQPQRHHASVSVSSNRLKTKIHSKSDNYKEENVSSVHDKMDNVNTVACVYDCKWWVEYVLGTEE